MKKPAVSIRLKKVKGRVKILKVAHYKGSQIYIRQIGGQLFEYLVVFKGEIYSNYFVIKPKKGKKKLTKEEVAQSAAFVFAGGLATIDELLGISPEKKALEQMEELEKLTGRKAN